MRNDLLSSIETSRSNVSPDEYISRHVFGIAGKKFGKGGSMKDVVLAFDLDGTLIDSVHDVCRALNHTLVPLGRRPHTSEEVKGYLGCGAPVLMERAIQNTGEPLSENRINALTQAFLAAYRQNPVVETTVFPHVHEALDTLAGKGATLAICTNKPSITAHPVLKTLKLESLFDVVVCGDQVANRKPHGDHVIETIRACGGSPERAVMIGDSENDIDAANNAGVPSVVVTFGYSLVPHGDLGANAIIESMKDLPLALEKILSGVDGGYSGIASRKVRG